MEPALKSLSPKDARRMYLKRMNAALAAEERMEFSDALDQLDGLLAETPSIPGDDL